jgi:hypothetical protein
MKITRNWLQDNGLFSIGAVDATLFPPRGSKGGHSKVTYRGLAAVGEYFHGDILRLQECARNHGDTPMVGE